MGGFGRSEGRCHLAADVAGFADAAYDDATAAGKNEFHGPRKMIAVKRFCHVGDGGGFAREDFAPEFNGALSGKLNRHRNSVGKRWLMGKRSFYL